MKARFKRQCIYCGEVFYATRPHAMYCCASCTGSATLIKKYYQEHPVTDLKGWKWHAKGMMKAACKKAKHGGAVIDLLPCAQWDDLITLITAPYDFWEGVEDEEMDEVVSKWVEPIEGLLDLPARCQCDRPEAKQALQAVKNSSYKTYVKKKERKQNGKIA